MKASLTQNAAIATTTNSAPRRLAAAAVIRWFLPLATRASLAAAAPAAPA